MKAGIIFSLCLVAVLAVPQDNRRRLHKLSLQLQDDDDDRLYEHRSRVMDGRSENQNHLKHLLSMRADQLLDGTDIMNKTENIKADSANEKSMRSFNVLNGLANPSYYQVNAYAVDYENPNLYKRGSASSNYYNQDIHSYVPRAYSAAYHGNSNMNQYGYKRGGASSFYANQNSRGYIVPRVDNYQRQLEQMYQQGDNSQHSAHNLLRCLNQGAYLTERQNN